MPTSKTFVWKDPRPMTLAVTVVLGIDIVYAVLGIAIIASGLHVNHSAPAAERFATGLILLLFALLWLVFLAGNIVTVFWILRVSKNAHVLRRRPLANSPIFAALWWYIIPVMSLFKPWESLVEIWDASAADRERARNRRYIVGLWWGLLLMAGAAGYIAAFSGIRLISIISFVLSLASDSLFIAITRIICSMQLEKHVGLAFSDEPDRPVSILERLNV
jgi:hypothetical protein